MKKIAVLTSGGDAPGMNACIRAVVRTALYHQVEVVGIYRGYNGLVEGDFTPLHSRDVSNIIQKGGTILKTARSKSFLDYEFRKQAFENLQKAGIEGLVAIGGEGTLTGAQVFSQEFGVPIVGAPGTIDNDLAGTDFTIGFDTAVNTALDAIDKIRDTAHSLQRGFFIEVMGRHCGDIALWTGVGGGAEIVMLPEVETTIEEVVQIIRGMLEKAKTSLIIVVAEGDPLGNAQILAEKVQKFIPDFNFRVTNIGHVQRGGSPTAADRLLGSRLGVAATEALLKGHRCVMAGEVANKIVLSPFETCIKGKKEQPQDLLDMMRILSL
ncbi:6-phosphofructokinase [Hugenholtzia roseola]|uniref:6-phosphofructokinase n=1 Tax=Hugenholtzia roseola TaxID=1002 RepID=UPI00042288E9|nr:6-phosphofructokinase [Hugenholtzia roseola]